MVVDDGNGGAYHAWHVTRWLYGAAWRWGMWFRIFGRGPHIARDRMRLFSERYGYRNVYRFGRWSFEWLSPTSTRSAK